MHYLGSRRWTEAEPLLASVLAQMPDRVPALEGMALVVAEVGDGGARKKRRHEGRGEPAQGGNAHVATPFPVIVIALSPPVPGPYATASPRHVALNRYSSLRPLS